MKLDFAFFAEAARLEESGIFSVLGGGFDVLENDGPFPVTKTTMVLLVRVKLAEEEWEHEHEALMRIIAPNGSTIPPETRIRFSTFDNESKPEPENWVAMCFDYSNVSFPTPGKYRFALSIDNHNVGEATLTVVAEEKPT